MSEIIKLPATTTEIAKIRGRRYISIDDYIIFLYKCARDSTAEVAKQTFILLAKDLEDAKYE